MIAVQKVACHSLMKWQLLRNERRGVGAFCLSQQWAGEARVELSHWHTAAKAAMSVTCPCHRSNSNNSKIRSGKRSVSINHNGAVSKGFLRHQ